MNTFFLLIFSFLVLFKHSAAVSSNEEVPVLIWGKNVEFSVSSGLSSFSTARFSQLANNLTSSSPPILLFVEHELSLEDLSARNDRGERVFKNLNSIAQNSDYEFLSSVARPLKVIANLEETKNYVLTHYKDYQSVKHRPLIIMVSLHSDPLKDRLETLKAHDKRIAAIYKELSSEYPDLLAIYTGHKNIYYNSRAKRDTPATNTSVAIVTDDSKYALLASSLVYDSVELGNPTKVTYNPSPEPNTFAAVTATFSQGSTLVFGFTGTEETFLSWSLDHINDSNSKTYIPETSIWAPAGHSYYCAKSTTFTSKSDGKTIVLKDMQVQAFLKDNNFGDAIDCVPYFTMAIWSGVFIVGLLLLILSWGVIMMMDINTMDRFDDPKGKTITISAIE